jgi:Rad3-related DNA helicase
MWNKDDKQQCPFYRNIIRPNNDSNNNEFNFLPSAQYDIEEQLNLISNHELCPYYVYFFNIMKDNYDIIVCHHKDFFDLRQRVSLQKLTNYKADPFQFTLVFDECNNINENIISSYSSVIDETLLNNARIELYLLKEAINTYGVNNYEMNIDEEKESSPSLTTFKPEKEILNYSLIVENGNRKFPGNIRRSEHFLNLISRLLIHFSNELISKEEQRHVPFLLRAIYRRF